MTAVRVYVNKDPEDFSMRAIISICDMNNMDYDGDECYLLFPCRDEVETELAQLYRETWGDNINIGELTDATAASMSFQVRRSDGQMIEIPCTKELSMTMGFNAAATTQLSHQHDVTYRCTKMKPHNFPGVWEYMMSIDRVENVAIASRYQIELQANSTTAISDAYELMRIPCIMMMGCVMVPYRDGVSVSMDIRIQDMVVNFTDLSASCLTCSMAAAMTLLCKFGKRVHQAAMNTKKHGRADGGMCLREMFTSNSVGGRFWPTTAEVMEAMTYCVSKDEIVFNPVEVRSLSLYVIALKEVSKTYDLFDSIAVKDHTRMDRNFMLGNGVGDVRYFRNTMALLLRIYCRLWCCTGRVCAVEDVVPVGLRVGLLREVQNRLKPSEFQKH